MNAGTSSETVTAAPEPIKPDITVKDAQTTGNRKGKKSKHGNGKAVNAEDVSKIPQAKDKSKSEPKDPAESIRVTKPEPVPDKSKGSGEKGTPVKTTKAPPSSGAALPTGDRDSQIKSDSPAANSEKKKERAGSSQTKAEKARSEGSDEKPRGKTDSGIDGTAASGHGAASPEPERAKVSSGGRADDVPSKADGDGGRKTQSARKVKSKKKAGSSKVKAGGLDTDFSFVLPAERQRSNK
jgi:hypothetical protein